MKTKILFIITLLTLYNCRPFIEDFMKGWNTPMTEKELNLRMDKIKPRINELENKQGKFDEFLAEYENKLSAQDSIELVKLRSEYTSLIIWADQKKWVINK